MVRVQELVNSGADVNQHDVYEGSPLSLAAGEGQVAIVKFLLGKGARAGEPGQVDGDYGLNYAIYGAAVRGHTEIVKLLLADVSGDKGADRKATLDSLLRLAVNMGHDDLARWSVEQGADVNQAPANHYNNNQQPVSLAFSAASRGKLKLLSYLLAHGASEDNAQVRLVWGAFEGKLDVMKNALANGAEAESCVPGMDEGEEECATPMTAAIKGGKIKAVEFLLQQGVNASVYMSQAICQGNQVLMRMILTQARDHPLAEGELASAIRCGKKENAVFLMQKMDALDYGTLASNLTYDVSAVQAALVALVFEKDSHLPEHGDGMLQGAIQSGNARLVDYLYSRNVTVSQENLDGYMLSAAQNGHKEVLGILLQKGGKVDTRSDWGNTPLLRAVPYQQTDVVVLLLKHGADVNAKNELFNTPLHMAAARDYADIARLLINNGARVNSINEDGNMPLHQSARFPAGLTTMKLLLENKARVNARNKRGMTALHYLVIRGADYKDYEEVVNQPNAAVQEDPEQAPEPLASWQRPQDEVMDEIDRKAGILMLLNYGADPGIRNTRGESALDLAYKYIKDAELLRAMAAKVGAAKH